MLQFQTNVGGREGPSITEADVEDGMHNSLLLKLEKHVIPATWISLFLAFLLNSIFQTRECFIYKDCFDFVWICHLVSTTLPYIYVLLDMRVLTEIIGTLHGDISVSESFLKNKVWILIATVPFVLVQLSFASFSPVHDGYWVNDYIWPFVFAVMLMMYAGTHLMITDNYHSLMKIASYSDKFLLSDGVYYQPEVSVADCRAMALPVINNLLQNSSKFDTRLSIITVAVILNFLISIPLMKFPELFYSQVSNACILIIPLWQMSCLQKSVNDMQAANELSSLVKFRVLGIEMGTIALITPFISVGLYVLRMATSA